MAKLLIHPDFKKGRPVSFKNSKIKLGGKKKEKLFDSNVWDKDLYDNIKKKGTKK